MLRLNKSVLYYVESSSQKKLFQQWHKLLHFKSVIHTFCGGVLVSINVVGGFGRGDLTAATVLSNWMVENGYEI
jgi:hypothetical protein